MDNEIGIDSKIIKAGFWHMPKIFYLVLFIEFCERFAYYGFQSIVVTYSIKKFNLIVANTEASLASFNILLYALAIIGGIVADKILGLRRTYILGILFLLVGYSSLFIFSNLFAFNFCLALILTGNILFKANTANYISKCFESKDPRLDLAYTYYYMFMNMGCLFSIMLMPGLVKDSSYNVAFILSIAIILLATLLYLVFRKEFIHSDNYRGKNGKFLDLIMIVVIAASFGLAYILGLLLASFNFCQNIFYFSISLTILSCLFVVIKFNKHEAKGIYLALILILIAIVFWMIFLQIISIIDSFSLHHVRFILFGYNIPMNIMYYLNTFYIIIFAPFLASSYVFLQKRNINISIPLKFNLGIAIIGINTIILALAAKYTSDMNSQISVAWLFLVDILLAFAVLLVLAIGPSMVSQLFPRRVGGIAQGIWLLSIATGILMRNKIFSFIHASFNGANNIIVFNSYTNIFFKFGFMITAFSLFLLFFSKILAQKMQEVIKHRI